MHIPPSHLYHHTLPPRLLCYREFDRFSGLPKYGADLSSDEDEAMDYYDDEEVRGGGGSGSSSSGGLVSSSSGGIGGDTSASSGGMIVMGGTSSSSGSSSSTSGNRVVLQPSLLSGLHKEYGNGPGVVEKFPSTQPGHTPLAPFITAPYV